MVRCVLARGAGRERDIMSSCNDTYCCPAVTWERSFLFLFGKRGCKDTSGREGKEGGKAKLERGKGLVRKWENDYTHLESHRKCHRNQG